MYKTTFTFALDNSAIATRSTYTHYMDKAMQAFDVPGATWTEHQGAYVMADGTTVVEPSYSLDVITETLPDRDDVKAFAGYIKEQENQESVMVELATPVVEFI